MTDTAAHDTAKLESFLHAQVKAWNAHDRDAFFKVYRAMAPGKLEIEYVGRSTGEGWAILENMWDTTNAIVEVEVITTILNGREAACHHINHMPSLDRKVETIELYRFDGDDLYIRYFIKA